MYIFIFEILNKTNPEREVKIILEHLGSPVFSGVRVAQSLALYFVFVNICVSSLLSFFLRDFRTIPFGL